MKIIFVNKSNYIVHFKTYRCNELLEINFVVSSDANLLLFVTVNFQDLVKEMVKADIKLLGKDPTA